MIAPTLAEIADALGGRVVRGAPDETTGTVGIDSRTGGDALVEVLLTGPGAIVEGVTVLDDAADGDPDSTAGALKALAMITRPDRRSIAVLGAVAAAGPDAREEHDHLGRLVVRLNVAQLVVVGDAARHLHAAAGLEGSWDGESVLVPDPEAAYAFLREELRPGDVMLVKSSATAGLRTLVTMLGGAA